MCGILAILQTESISSDQLETLKKLIDKRGPDYSAPLSNHTTTCGIKLQLKASILHLRGDTMQKQPFHDEHSNILLFNGQIYKLFNETLKEDRSDTTILAEKLQQCQSTDEIANVFSNIDGPFAFIYWHNNLNSLFYGRDIFGRKSLCSLHNDNNPIPCAISSLALHSNQSDTSANVYSWSEVDCTGLHCYQFNSDGFLIKRLKYLWNLDAVYPPNEKCPLPPKDPNIEYVTMPSSLLTSLNKDLRLPEEFSEADRKRAIHGLEEKLLRAVEVRIKYNRRTCLECRKSNLMINCSHSKVAVAFSGGIDSTLLALALDKVLEPQETIDLTTVAFKSESPDRSSVGDAFKELRTLCPHRNWRLILCDISIPTLQSERKETIRHLISPCNTVVDDSLGCGCWFISRAKGRALDSLIKDSTFEEIFESFLQYNVSDEVDGRFISNYTSPASMLFAGMSIDEQLGGYSSHRAAWSSAKVEGVYGEICKQMRRISSRNMGRDDRTCSHHGRDVKLPYLDMNLVSYLNELPISIKMNLNEPLDIGPKKLLRELALNWRLTRTGARVKRALQFGTRIANLESPKEHGNEICSRLL